MVKSGCKPEDLDNAIILHNRQFEMSGAVTYITGAVFGQFFEA